MAEPEATTTTVAVIGGSEPPNADEEDNISNDNAFSPTVTRPVEGTLSPISQSQADINGSPLSLVSSYPQTPPNSCINGSMGEHFRWSTIEPSSLLNPQELLSKLDTRLSTTGATDSEYDCENSSSRTQEASDVEEESFGRLEYERTELPGTEEAFELFRLQNEEFIQHMDSIETNETDEDLYGRLQSSEERVPPTRAGVNINVEEYLFDLHNENVVASNICQEMISDRVDATKYLSYISELPNSREQYQKMMSKFVAYRSFVNCELENSKSQPKRSSFGTITSQAQECITDPLTTAMLSRSLLVNDQFSNHINDKVSLKKKQIVDFEILRFMHTDVDYREPLLASERECQERNRYLKSVQSKDSSRNPSTPKTKLIPSESEMNINIFDEWQDDEIPDLAKSESVLFNDEEDCDIDDPRESFDEQKRKIEEEYGINLDDSTSPTIENSFGGNSLGGNNFPDGAISTASEFEWDDQELGGGFGSSDVDVVSTDVNLNEKHVSEENFVDTSINIQATRRWRLTSINGVEKRIDMKVIDPFKKVLSHGGFTDSGHIILVFSACYMPEKKRPDYKYILENLFLYVISAIQAMITGSYVLVYLHGGANDSVTPSLNWLKKCYSHIERRVRKLLLTLYVVHPDFWVKTGLKLAKMFTSSKFEKKLKFVSSLASLSHFVPMDCIYIPDSVRLIDSQLMAERKEQALQGLM